MLAEGTEQVNVVDAAVPLYAVHPELDPLHDPGHVSGEVGLSLMVIPDEPFPVWHSEAGEEELVEVP